MPQPRWKTLTVRVAGGFLLEGDRIEIVLGDTSKGSPGLKLQSMVEPNFEFKVAADVCAVGHFTPIPNTPNINIVPGGGGALARRPAQPAPSRRDFPVRSEGG